MGCSAFIGGRARILLVEDDAGVRTLVKRLLEGSGYRVHSASDSGEALSLLAAIEEPIDLLLTDYVMPGMVGDRLAELVQENHPRVKVLYMSGYTEVIGRQKGVPFLAKPFSRATLAAKVGEALGDPCPSGGMAANV